MQSQSKPSANPMGFGVGGACFGIALHLVRTMIKKMERTALWPAACRFFCNFCGAAPIKEE